ncbi:BatA domain-containing protein [Chitinophaga qingshengii]|uniref:BatA domain-containing protein n=1 Tax=Chitinophaga qingshengii TaxID=1569794 RepID=A0ABR7TJX0_9BACT|nr:BatA domain-containing protein [Chitinophaga qingshengii]MBC9929714.1 BatA domain-containing protein [Chitinophaga qingshengii]
MLHLLQPIWMTLAAGIAVPVFIHLWHRRPGKVLKISSVQLLTAASVRHARSWRISDWWLLLLRCLLIILLALLLSQPVWRQPLTTRTVKGWVVTEKAAYPAFTKQIDSLLQAGFQLHSPDTGFARLRQPADLPPDTATGSYWELVQSLSQKVPADLPVYLFTGNRLARFSGPMPAVALPLHWQTMTPADSVNNWNDYTYLTDGDSLRIRQGSSTSAGTTFSWHDTLPGTDTSTLTYTIFTDKYPEDARYLEAALKAVQQYTRRKTSLRLVKQSTAVPATQDWLWWLSDSQVPTHVKAGRIIRYATGKPLQQSSTIAGTGIRVFQRLPLADTSGAIWRDGYGTPLLTGTTLYTHLNPAWNELPWSGQFPEKLLELMYPVASGKQHDRRSIDTRQLVLPVEKAAVKHWGVPQQETSLEKITWIILFGVFCIERYLSSKTAFTRE